MDNTSLYNIIERENIDLINYKWTNTKARIFEINNEYCIAIDNARIETSFEEKEILAEELRTLFLQLSIFH